jgi:NAD(P) transhydrogenase subunit alpha
VFAVKVGVPKEIHPDERLVAAVPETVKRLKKLGFAVLIERGAGERADASDDAYRELGCEIVSDAATLWRESDLVIKVRPPQQHPVHGCHELDLLREGGTLISFLWPEQRPELRAHLQRRKATALAMDAVPRISRAQKMDARSSMANISGYRAVVEAAHNFGRFFTGQITAAGKVPPAKVLVIGAGVAGLAAIGAARALGAVVRAFDTRGAVREQIESMGAEFITVSIEEDGEGVGGYGKSMSERFLAAERELFEEQAKEVDIIISTALIPGQAAPLLISDQAVRNLRDGSVIVDLAAEQGGNCEHTVAGEMRTKYGVKIIGYTDFPARMAAVSSQLYGNNLCHLLDDMGGAEKFNINENDDVVRGALVVHNGENKWPPPPLPPPSPVVKKSEPVAVAKSGHGHGAPASGEASWWPLLVGGAGLMLVGMSGSDAFLAHFTVFVLACFVGYQVIWNVSPALHTPLMSVTNAISGIIIVGGMLQIGGEWSSPAALLGFAAIFVATINIAGGFLVTHRMLKMFHR